MRPVLVFCVALLLFCSSAPQAAEKVDPAAAWLVSQPRRYFTVYGKWPRSWLEIERSGLMQCKLRDADGREVTPDDQIVGQHDVRFIFKSEQLEPPIYHRLKPDGNVRIDKPIADAPQTWSSFGSQLLREGSEHHEFLLRRFRDDLNLRRLLALTSALREGVDMYVAAKGHAPPDWDAYISSGYAPVGEDAENPFTGRPLVADGGNHSIYYQPGSGGAYTLRINGMAGKVLWDGPWLK